MKKLDEAFCQWAVANHLVPEDVLAFHNRQKDIVTTREALLIQGDLSLETYDFVLSRLETGDIAEDPESSGNFDRRFFECGIRRQWIAPEDIEKCNGQPGLPLSRRERLLLSRTISCETYKKIMMELCFPHAGDISAETVIDEPKTTTTSTILDSPLPKMKADSLETPPMGMSEQTPPMGMPQQQDDSAETMVDVDPTEEEIPGLPAIGDGTSEKTVYTGYDGRAAVKKAKEGDLPGHVQDESAETIVDANPLQPESSEHLPAEVLSRPQALADKPKDTGDGSAETLIDQPVDIHEGETAVFPDGAKHAEETIDFPEPRKKPAKLRNESPTGMYVKEDMPQLLGEEDGWESQELEDSQALTTPLVKTLVKEVTREVNLQTQQISRVMNERLKGHNIMLGIAIFVAVFLLIFTGIIEWQRIKELEKVKRERDLAADARDMSRTEKERALLDRIGSMSQVQDLRLEKERSAQSLSIAEADAQRAREELAKTRQSRERLEAELKRLEDSCNALEREMKETLEDFYPRALGNYWQFRYPEALSQIGKAIKRNKGQARLYAWRAIIYQELRESGKARDDIKRAAKLAGADADALCAISRYWQHQGDYERALKALTLPENMAVSEIWKIHITKANIFLLKNETELAQQEWDKACQVNPDLKKLSGKR